MQILGYAGSYGEALETIKSTCPEAWANRNFSIQHYGCGYHKHKWVMLLIPESVNLTHEPN